MRKFILSLAALLALLIVTSCGGSPESSVPASADYEMNTFSADTMCMLFKGNDAPRCDVRYRLRYAEGSDAAFINDILIRSMFPQVNDSTDLEQAALAEMRGIVADYKATLRGVTRKSISEGLFPFGMAQYKRSVTTSSKEEKGSVLVYTAVVEEKAYGETDSLVCSHTFNISLTHRSLITVDDIFVPGHKDRLAHKIVEKLSSRYNTSGIEGLQRKGFFADGIPYASDNFIISGDAVTFVYNPFEIAGRRYGTVMVTIPADELKDIMEKEWITFFATK